MFQSEENTTNTIAVPETSRSLEHWSYDNTFKSKNNTRQGRAKAEQYKTEQEQDRTVQDKAKTKYKP